MEYQFYTIKYTRNKSIETALEKRNTLTEEVAKRLDKLGAGWKISHITTVVFNDDLVYTIVFEKQ